MNEQRKAATSRQPGFGRSRWIVAVTSVIGLTLLSGWLHGRMSQRWGMNRELTRAGERLASFPERIGDWQQEKTYELGRSAIELLQCQGYIHRGYRNQLTGDYVKLAVMVGPGSKMSIHVPEICYEASNFSLLGPRRRFEIETAEGTQRLWTVQFQVNDVSERRVRVFYGWSNGGAWTAPLFPRWSIAGYPVLYKLQVSQVDKRLTLSDGGDQDDVIRPFLHDVLIALRTQIDQPDGVSDPTGVASMD